MLDLWCEVILATLMSYVRALCWVYADKYLVDAGGHMYRRKTGHPIVGDKKRCRALVFLSVVLSTVVCPVVSCIKCYF